MEHDQIEDGHAHCLERQADLAFVLFQILDANMVVAVCLSKTDKINGNKHHLGISLFGEVLGDH